MTIRGIPQNRRWQAPKAAERAADSEVRGVVRAIVGAITELRDGAVLGTKRRAHLTAAIHHVEQMASDVSDEDLPAPSCTLPTRSRRSAATVRQDLATMKRDSTRPRPRTTPNDLAWSLLRLREAGR